CNKNFKPQHAGPRAIRPDEILHIDVTHIKLSDGTRYYLHILIENFSRKILAWILNKKLSALTTVELIQQAKTNTLLATVDLITDGGSENVNGVVSAALDATKPRIVHKIARVEIKKSNSMAESSFHSLKNCHLYNQQLNNGRDALRNVGFYMGEHNDVIPLTVLSGLTPTESYGARILKNW
ncbi:MAG: DDE-type integrase/transposase/recombinase, partial [Proteobacteria bacterium]|nr:DDE-type integrase/transposase/recombinase [Pseudomonadota bacterium]